MVERNVGNDGEQGIDNVGAIQTTTQSHFYNGKVYLLFGKILESHCSSQFKERWVQWFEEIAMVFNKINYVLFRNHFAVYSDAFPEVYEVWTCVKPYFIAIGLEYCSQCMRARTFSVASCNMDRTEVLMRSPEVFVQCEGCR